MMMLMLRSKDQGLTASPVPSPFTPFHANGDRVVNSNLEVFTG